MSKFMQGLESETNNTTTDNGAPTPRTTLNPCLDLFAQIGACNLDLKLAERLFLLAWESDKVTTLKILFWVRDIRGGDGRREVFLHLLNLVATKEPELVIELLPLIPEYGRWKDIFALYHNKAITPAINALVKNQLDKDIEALGNQEPISLLGKWLPSNNSGNKSRAIAKQLTHYLGITPKQYRKMCTSLRAQLKIVETQMCSSNWGDINYSKVPSIASKMYRNAFNKHDTARYNEFLEKAKTGEVKINTATLTPYDLVKDYKQNPFVDETIEAQWVNLPNYMERPFNGLVVADTSSSMTWTGGDPFSVCLSLAIYIAERNKSAVWKNKFITFSSRPSLQTVVGTSLRDKIDNLSKADWEGNTDIEAVFQLILKTAKSYNLKQEDLPELLIIVSDMQFDISTTNSDLSNFESAKKDFKDAGYELPQLVFWNVRASSNTPITIHDTGTCIVSGYSPSKMMVLLSAKDITPLGILNSTINVERYKPIENIANRY
jgi:hypothetical protein